MGVVAALLAIGLIAASCGGGDEEGGGTLSPEEYFERLEAAAQKFEREQEAFDDVSTVFSGAFAEDFDVGAAKAWLRAVSDSLDDFSATIRSLTPPAAIAALHRERLELITSSADTLRDVADRAPAVVSGGELATIVLEQLDTPEGLRRARRIGEICEDLQDFATGNGIDGGPPVLTS